MIEATANRPPNKPGRKPKEPVRDWLENHSENKSRFKSDNGSFSLEGRGFVGSIQKVDADLLRDPFVKRAISRGVVGQLSEQEAWVKMDSLVDKDFADDDVSAIMDSLSEGASERVSRYRKDLPEEAEAGKSISAEEVWKNKRTDSDRPRTVQRSADSEVHPTVDGGQTADYKVTITPKVKQGEF